MTLSGPKDGSGSTYVVDPDSARTNGKALSDSRGVEDRDRLAALALDVAFLDLPAARVVADAYPGVEWQARIGKIPVAT